jgi:hypothetical protein
MKLDLKKSFKAPFYTSAPEGLLKVYLIALGWFLAVWLVHFIFTVFGLASTVFICLVHIFHIGVMIATQSTQIGYFLESIRCELAGDQHVMPSWQGNIPRYFWKGTILQFVIAVYFAIMAIFILVFYVIAVFIVPLDINVVLEQGINRETGSSLIVLLLLFWLIPILTGILFLVISPFVVISYAESLSFKGAFNIINIFSLILKRFPEYLLAVIIATVLFVIITIITLLLCITIVGWIAGALIQFTGIIIVLNMFAQVYKSANSAS